MSQYDFVLMRIKSEFPSMFPIRYLLYQSTSK